MGFEEWKQEVEFLLGALREDTLTSLKAARWLGERLGLCAKCAVFVEWKLTRAEARDKR